MLDSELASREWKVYTHALDEDTLAIRYGSLRRIDLQLLAMIRKSQKVLKQVGIETHRKVLLHGFSASGNFVNRFTALHPQAVQASASGGVNGMPILPVSTYKQIRVPYPVGVAGLEELIGRKFDIPLYSKVPQFIYMGANDKNDTLTFRDAFDRETSSLILRLLGPDMLADRWTKIKTLYSDLKQSARFVTYKGVTHKITPAMKEDIISFFQGNIEKLSE